MGLPHIQIGDGLLGEALLASVDVTQELNQHWWCTVVCRQTNDQRVPVEDLLGKPVEIKTTDEAGVEHLHFSGFIYDVALSYEVWGSYTATLTAVSDSYVFDVAKRKQYYTAGTLASLGGILAGRNGLPVAVNAPAAKALNYVQYGETDFAFLNRVVDDYGAWLRPAEHGVEIFTAFQPGSTVQWRDHEGLLEFSLTGNLVPPGFDGAHYDHHAMESQHFQQATKAPNYFDGAQALTAAVQAASQKLPSGFEPQRARAMTLSDYNTQLEAEAERALGAAVTGEGVSQNQQLKAGDTVLIQGDLDAAGTYGLIRVAHSWKGTGYSNTFVCTPWKDYRNPSPPPVQSWQGVVPARVTAHDDPKKMGRLQVQFFWQEDGATHWARMVSPHAGPDRGMMFMPEIGDEVVVLFEDGDPERPVILGSVWNGVQQAPRYALRGDDVAGNDVKRFITKSGNRLQMSDKPGAETVVIATPNHTSVNLTDNHDDSKRPMVHLHSSGDILLTAPNGRVHINSLYFSRDIGPASAPVAGGGGGAPAQPAAAAPPPEGFFHGLAGGLYGSTLQPLAHMVRHPLDTLAGVGHAIAHPVDTVSALGHAAAATGRGILSGDGRSFGTALGTVGMLAVPGAGEAGAVEDAARVGQLGELADVSKVGEAGEVADASKVTDAVAEADAPGASRLVSGSEPNFNPLRGEENCGACSTSVDNYLDGKPLEPAPLINNEWPVNAPIESPAWKFDTNPSDIESSLTNAGDGAKGIVYVGSTDASHVFNAYNSDGQIMAFDGQNGASGTIQEVAGRSNYLGDDLQWGFHPTGK